MDSNQNTAKPSETAETFVTAAFKGDMHKCVQCGESKADIKKICDCRKGGHMCNTCVVNAIQSNNSKCPSCKRAVVVSPWIMNATYIISNLTMFFLACFIGYMSTYGYSESKTDGEWKEISGSLQLGAMLFVPVIWVICLMITHEMVLPRTSANETQLITSIILVVSVALYLPGALYNYMRGESHPMQILLVSLLIWILICIAIAVVFIAKFVIEDILAEHKKRNAADRPTEYTLSDGTKVKIPAKSAKKD